MKLGAYQISGGNTSTVSSYSTADLEGNQPFVFGASLPSGYDDISGIEEWDKYGERAGADYIRVRSEIKGIAEPVGWSSLNSAEKAICAQRFFSFVTGTNRDEIYTEAEQRLYALKFFQCMQEARGVRLARSEGEAFLWLSEAQQQEIVDDIIGDGLIEKYLMFSRTGKYSGDDEEGLLDYINGYAGTKYASGGAVPGLAHKGWAPHGRTLSELVIEMTNIIEGNA